jgi:hypothetical protein
LVFVTVGLGGADSAAAGLFRRLKVVGNCVLQSLGHVVSICALVGINARGLLDLNLFGLSSHPPGAFGLGELGITAFDGAFCGLGSNLSAGAWRRLLHLGGIPDGSI